MTLVAYCIVLSTSTQWRLLNPVASRSVRYYLDPVHYYHRSVPFLFANHKVIYSI